MRCPLCGHSVSECKVCSQRQVAGPFITRNIRFLEYHMQISGVRELLLIHGRPDRTRLDFSGVIAYILYYYIFCCLQDLYVGHFPCRNNAGTQRLWFNGLALEKAASTEIACLKSIRVSNIIDTGCLEGPRWQLKDE